VLVSSSYRPISKDIAALTSHTLYVRSEVKRRNMRRSNPKDLPRRLAVATTSLLTISTLLELEINLFVHPAMHVSALKLSNLGSVRV
jgi:hypothetical protein